MQFSSPINTPNTQSCEPSYKTQIVSLGAIDTHSKQLIQSHISSCNVIVSLQHLLVFSKKFSLRNLLSSRLLQLDNLAKIFEIPFNMYIISDTLPTDLQHVIDEVRQQYPTISIVSSNITLEQIITQLYTPSNTDLIICDYSTRQANFDLLPGIMIEIIQSPNQICYAQYPSSHTFTTAEKLYCYLWHQLLPAAPPVPTTNFIAFASNIRPEFFPCSLSLPALTYKTYNIIETRTTNHLHLDIGTIHKSLHTLCESLSDINSTPWQQTFIKLINHLTHDMLTELINQCPTEITNSTLLELCNTNKITAFELAALSCSSDNPDLITSNNTIITNDSLYTDHDCWYDSDAFDAKCCHTQRHEKCPVLIKPILSPNGIYIHPQLIDIDYDYIKNNHNNIIGRLNRDFSAKYFEETPTPPLPVGFIEDQEQFSRRNLAAQPQNVPIKMPFTEYRLPHELLQFQELVQKVANFWHSLNNEYGDYYYCYFSVAQSNVPPGCYQRRGHLHSDGFQSHWIKHKLFSDFTFIVSDTASTEFFLQPFDTSSLDPAKHNYYKYFKKNMTSKAVSLRQPYEILTMDSYALHKAIKNSSSETIQRTFVRIMYSVIRWPSQSNAHNYMFDYNWPPVKRTLLSTLK